jgi:hypothetical protein
LKINYKYKYKNGKPFQDPLGRELQLLNRRVREDKKAAMLIIDGGVGEGKTTLAVHCAEEINSGPIDFNKQLAMGGLEFAKKLKICYEENLPVIIYDEAGDFNSRGSLTKFNAMLNRIFETYRAFKVTVILCLPNFNVLDHTLLDKGIVRGLIHCYQRNNKQGNYRGYSLWRGFYIKDKMKKLIVKPSAYSYTTPNFYGHFLDLEPVRSGELDKYSTDSKVGVLESVHIKLDGLLSYKELARRLGRSIAWVSKNIKILKIPAKKIYKTRKYFEESALEILSEKVEEFNTKHGAEYSQD